MNILRIPDDELLFVAKDQIDEKQMVERFVIDQSSIFYILDGEKIIGSITRKELPVTSLYGLSKPYIFHFGYRPNTPDIIRAFENHPTLSRISVFVNGCLLGEYRNVDDPYIAKTISKSILALRYVPLVSEMMNEWVKTKNIRKILLIGNPKISEYLSRYFKTEVETIDLESAYNHSEDNVTIFDFKYGRFLRKLLNLTGVEDFSNFMTKFLIQKTLAYLNEMKVDYFVVHDSVFSGMTCLSNAEQKVFKNKVPFNELINDKNYLDVFSESERDFSFLKNRLFLKTAVFYSGLTIRQTDVSSDEIHVSNGVRYSGEYPSDYTSEAHFYGPCSVLGLCGSDDYTFESQLQRKLNDAGLGCRIFNHGVMIGNNGLNSFAECLRTPLKQGDVVFLFLMEKDFLPYIPKEKRMKMCDIFNKGKTNDEICFFDVPGHLNRRGNEILADAFFKLLEKKQV